ncbi:hypothetical protein [Neptunomonas sp. XY-337]|uniref:hypothetical protein n=1 Tax=Neptunomonas sp. XY-337 TaxID=2561897 RepID=UPI0010AB3A0C|nr:hypothetical protein [Neptunomonas sp. XY-337]
MKIKKSDVARTVHWVESHFDKNDHFPFDAGSSKAAKRHLKALKSWRQVAANKEELREWCNTWLSEDYKLELTHHLEKARILKANKSLNLNNEALELLLTHADEKDMTPSELIISLLS